MLFYDPYGLTPFTNSGKANLHYSLSGFHQLVSVLCHASEILRGVHYNSIRSEFTHVTAQPPDACSHLVLTEAERCSYRRFPQRTDVRTFKSLLNIPFLTLINNVSTCTIVKVVKHSCVLVCAVQRFIGSIKFKVTTDPNTA